MKIVVLGAGSWGTALACLCAGQGHEVTLWGRSPDAVQTMSDRRCNDRYLPGISFPANLKLQSDVQVALLRQELAIVAMPSSAIYSVISVTEFKGLVVCASKGLQPDTGETLDVLIGSLWPSAQVVLLSGPTFAVEIAQGKPAAVVAASRDAIAAQAVQAAMSCEIFRVYTSSDVVGVAIGGALKNVIAIAAGCSDALGFGTNARAALITRGLNEVGRLAERLGGDPLTLSGLAGLGDLVLTCTGELSRNRTIGFALGRGEHLSAVSARLGQVAEGVETAETALRLAERLGIDMPITRQVAAVLSGKATAREAVATLLAREVSKER